MRAMVTNYIRPPDGFRGSFWGVARPLPGMELPDVTAWSVMVKMPTSIGSGDSAEADIMFLMDGAEERMAGRNFEVFIGATKVLDVHPIHDGYSL